MAAAVRSRLDGRRGRGGGGGGGGGRGPGGAEGGAAVACVGAAGSEGLLDGFFLSPVPGIGIAKSSRFRRLWAATSSLVTVCGFNCATSFQDVSLPGAAPLST